MIATPTIYRRLILLSLALVPIALSGCGGGGSGGSDSAPASTATPVSNQPSEPVAPTQPNTSIPPAADAPQAPTYSSPSAQKQDALRLLEQATFGPTSADLATVLDMGVDAYLDRQFATGKTGYVGFNRTGLLQADDCKSQASAPASASSICARTHYSVFEIQRLFFVNALTGEDQLRQRVAFALSQIFVVSGSEVSHAAAMASYQNLLLDQAFGNFRDLMQDVTLHPAMGVYLDMVNNPRGSSTTGAKPNENYAREFLQLFTIGTEMLNIDGSVMIDSDGDVVPTYSQADVEAFARVFTGWTYPNWPGVAPRWTNPAKLVGEMVPIESAHDTALKQLLGVTLPAGQAARADLEQALDRVFQHPNVGPFISARLIQHLVTSNPAPEYVARVARIFNDNGAGVRGDLQAVILAILLDPEARGPTKTDSAYGRLKDPALFMTGFLRALGGRSDGVYLRSQAAAMGQNIFAAPSVFNYYSPKQRIGAGSLLGPEFGIFDGSSSLQRIDFVYELIYANGVEPDPTVLDSIGTSISLDRLNEAIADSKPSESLDERLMFGKLSATSFAALDASLDALAGDDMEGRARAAAYVLGVSAQYQVQR
jgi:uncharacterized protein (DUF1800 family)